MAVGNIVGVEPLPNGGYNFVDKAGAKKTLFGPAADELVQRFKASEALTAPQPTAKLDARDLAEKATPIAQAMGGALGGIPGAVAGYLGGRAAQEAASDVPTEVPGGEPPRPSVPVGTEGPPASIAREGQADPQAGPKALYAGAKPGETIMQNPDGTLFVRSVTAPTRGGPVEKSRTVKGEFGENEEYKKATELAFKEQQSAEELGAATAAHQAAEERGFLEEQQRQLIAQQQQQQAQMETIKRGVAEKQVAYDIAQSKYNNFSEIDQDRIWRKKGTGASILAVIGASLGAFGSALTKTPNFALEIINSAIDRDIRSQEQEIAINREAAGNALADLQRQTGSLDLAKAALGALQTQRVQLQLQAMANKAKTPAAIATFQKANGMLMQSYADKLEEYRQKAMGEVTKNIVNVAGSAGGVRNRLLTVQESQGLNTLHKSTAPQRDPGAVKEERAIGMQQERLASFRQRLSKYEPDATPLTNENRWLGGRVRTSAQDFLFGPGSAMRTSGEKNKRLVQDYESIKTDLTGVIAKGAGTGTLSDGDRAAITQGIAPGATVEELDRAIAIAEDVNRKTMEYIQQFGPVPAQEIPTRPVE
jgi:hypothetical protein